MARKQVIVQLDDELVEALDALAQEKGVSRSELLRQGAHGVLAAESIRKAELRQVDAYRRQPQDPALTEAFARLASENAPDW